MIMNKNTIAVFGRTCAAIVLLSISVVPISLSIIPVLFYIKHADARGIDEFMSLIGVVLVSLAYFATIAFFLSLLPALVFGLIITHSVRVRRRTSLPPICDLFVASFITMLFATGFIKIGNTFVASLLQPIHYVAIPSITFALVYICVLECRRAWDSLENDKSTTIA